MIVTLDFESLFTTDGYSLRNKDMSTSEYIRDERFEATLCAIKIGKRKTHVYGGMTNIGKALARIDWSNTDLLCHHAHFDGMILYEHFGQIVPRRYLCTLSMSRAHYGNLHNHDLDALSKRLGGPGKIGDILEQMRDKTFRELRRDKELYALAKEYAANDVDQTYFAYLELLKHYPPRELDLIDKVIRMFCVPRLYLDAERAQTELDNITLEREQLIAATGLDIAVLRSRKQFPEHLRAAGAEPPMKISKITGKETYALAKDDLSFTDLIAHPAPRVRQLVEAKLAVSSNNAISRIQRLLKMGEGGKPLVVYYNYSGALTHRLSGGNKSNFQNFNAERAGKSGELRRSIIAPKGFRLVVVDSSQIEARVNAWNAGQNDLISDFANKVDVYSKFASIAYGKPITKADPERYVGKTCMLGLGFMMGGPRLQVTLARGAGGPPTFLELDVCYRLVKTWRALNPAIVSFWEYAGNTIISDMMLGREGEWKAISWGKNHILLPSGLRLHYPDLRGYLDEPKTSGFFRNTNSEVRVENASYATREGRTKLYGGILTENIIQALARCVVFEQCLRITEETGCPQVMSSHDEGVFLAPEKDADAVLAKAIELFSTPPAWAPNLPVAAEGGHDTSYSK